MRIYEVGGAIRDELMGLESKDVDYAVEVGSFDEMLSALADMGFIFYQVKPEFFTVRAKAPNGSRLGRKNPDADFVLCRKDGPTEDGRRPQYVEPGTILDDLARRDFTMNAIARNTETGELIDPHGGASDIRDRVLRFVGDPMDRIREDGLRVLRALRFWITKDLAMHALTLLAIHSITAAEMVHAVAIERIREELIRMFAHNTLRAVRILGTVPDHLRVAIFRDGLWLKPTIEKRS